MEMNTRLQVEHPVTEAITGLDLVEWQLRVAAGEPLPLQQDELQDPRPRDRGAHLRREPRRQLPARHRHPAHAALARARGLSPQRRRRALHEPAAVRVDAGVREGDAISPYYDSMIAKLIVWGQTARRRSRGWTRRWRDTHIVGLHTNVAFLRRVVRTRARSRRPISTPR